MTRNERLYRKARMKQRGVALYRVLAARGGIADAEDYITAKAQGYSKTRTPCSCFACGNPRHWSKGYKTLTLGERQAQMDEQEQFADLAD